MILLSAAAQPQEARTRMLGDEWIGPDGNRRIASVGITIGEMSGADDKLYRHMELDWQAFPFQKGPYPEAALKSEEPGEVGVALDVNEAGVPTGCTVSRPSGNAAFDAHSCPHLLRYVRFHAALTREGQRTGAKLDVTVRYSVRIGLATPARSTPQPPVAAGRPPRPEQPIDAAALGITRRTKLPRWAGGISGVVRVEADGRATACTLISSTQVDGIDKGACDRMLAMRFRPGTDPQGLSVRSDYIFWTAFQ